MKRNKLVRKTSTAIMIAALSLSALSMPMAAFAEEAATTTIVADNSELARAVTTKATTAKPAVTTKATTAKPATTTTTTKPATKPTTTTPAVSNGDTGPSVKIGSEHTTKTWVDEQGQAWTDLIAADGKTIGTYKVPSVADKCSIRYYGVDKYQQKPEDVKIYGYRIIEPNYNQYGFIGWTETSAASECGVKLDSFQQNTDNVVQVVVKDKVPTSPYYNKERVITSDNITDLARSIMTDSAKNKKFSDDGQKIELTWSEENNCYMCSDAKPGTYVVLVEKEDRGTIYNPAIVSNDYADANVNCSLSNYIPTATDPNAPTHDSIYWNAKDFPYESGVNMDNSAFAAFGSVHPNDVKGLVTNENKDLSPQEQEEYLKSHTSVVYQKDTQLNGNVFTINHGHTNEDAITSHGVTNDNPNKGIYEGIVLGDADEAKVETMALYGKAYAKKSTIPTEKNIVDASVPKVYSTDLKKDSPEGYSKYDDVSIGDTVTFDLFTEVPYYAENYFKDEEQFLFALTDVQSKGLAKVKAENVHVYASTTNNMNTAQAVAHELVQGKELDKKNYTLTINDNNSFRIEFTKDFCLKNPGAKIVVRYNTTVTEDAIKGLEGNDNTYYLEYTTAPTPETPEGKPGKPSRGYKYDFAVTYTFTPTAYKLAEDGSISKAEDADNKVTTEDQADIASELTVDKPLAGARFILQRVGSHYTADGAKAQDTDLAPRTDIPKENVITLEDLKSIDKENDVRKRSGQIWYNGYQTWLLTSDENGMIKFDSAYNGIDEGIYTLQEIEAPKDYAINEKIYVIDVEPKYDESVQQFIGTDVKMAAANLDANNNIVKYDIADATFVNGKAYEYDEYGKLIQQYTYSESVSPLQDTYDGHKIQELVTKETTIHDTVVKWNAENSDEKDISADMVGIINTKLTRLPSTGGVGTVLFTVLGFASAIGGIVILDKATRKKDEDATA